MTTEILQSSLYKNSELLNQVEWVVFDEVHYINDNERGHVWEEILILLPKGIGIIMLSATVPNYMEFAQWVGEIKEAKVYVQNTLKRVVPLQHLLFIDKDLDKNNKNYGYNKNNKKLRDKENEFIDNITYFDQFKMIKKQKENWRRKDYYNNKKYKDNYNNYNNNVRSNPKITKMHYKIEEIVDYLDEKDLCPAVIFVFSIKRITEYAKMLSLKNLVSRQQKNEIINFYNSVVNSMPYEDQKIPQVQELEEILQSGIGMHHAGLLPILKETIEVLYSRGLIKILFATTSFSIGLNMPTRTVVFTDLYKFNDTSKCILSSSEYLQMCGRAGRRGKDDKGNIYIILDDKLSEKYGKYENTMQIIDMFSKKGTSVESQFRLSYKVIINFFYKNIKNIVQFFKESYIENSTFLSMPEVRKNIEELSKKVNDMKKIECEKNDIETISDYYIAHKNLIEKREKLFKNDYISQLLKDKGRIILYNDKKKKKDIYLLVVHHYTEYDGEIWCLYVSDDQKEIMEYKNSEDFNDKINQGPYARQGIKNEKYFSYFDIQYKDIVDICDFTLKCLSKKKSELNQVIQDEDGFDFYLGKNLNTILDELLNINNDLNNNKSKIKAINYSKASKNDFDLNKIIKMKEEYSKKQNNNPCHNCPLREKHYLEYEKNKKILDKLEENKKKISEDNLKYFKEFQVRIKILQNMGYIDEENNLTLKGKAAREITCCDCLIVTEVLFSNIFNKLSIAEITAFLSCFIADSNSDKINFEDPEISEEFTKAIGELKKIYENINEKEKKENFQESNYNRTIDFSIAHTIKSWMEGKHFVEILEECDLEEGKVYNKINRLSGFFDSIVEFYNVLGNKTEGEKYINAKAILLRDILVCKSLYLQDDLNLKELDS